MGIMEKKNIYTTQEAAILLGRSPSWVRKTARQEGIGRVLPGLGRGVRAFTYPEVLLLRAHVVEGTRRGRPRKEGRK